MKFKIKEIDSNEVTLHRLSKYESKDTLAQYNLRNNLAEFKTLRYLEKSQKH